MLLVTTWPNIRPSQAIYLPALFSMRCLSLMESSLKSRLFGAWRLVSFEQEAADGRLTYPLGPDVAGLLLYTPGSYMAANLMATGRTTTVNPALYANQDLKCSALDYLAYSGPYTTDEARQLVLHHATVEPRLAWRTASAGRHLRGSHTPRF